jgi:hypothetical protein
LPAERTLNGRPKVKGWLPHYMGFPFKAYTRGGRLSVLKPAL